MGSRKEWSSEDQRDIVILKYVQDDKVYSRLGKGTVSENMLLCCGTDTAYGPDSIWCISDKSALAVEIYLTWSLRSLNFLMMFEFSLCLLADSAINLDNDSSIVSLRAGYEEFPLLRW
ncbi:hypothetical protein Tco_1483600 [Tanacetum coccineum]